MLSVIGAWFRRYFSHPQAVFLAVALVLGFTIVLTMGHMLMPLLAAVVIAYLLEGLVGAFERRGAKRFWVVLLVFLLFLVFVGVFTLVAMAVLLYGLVAFAESRLLLWRE